MAMLKTAVSQEFLLTFPLPQITCKGQYVWSEFYNKDSNNFLLLSRKEATEEHTACALDRCSRLIIVSYLIQPSFV